MEKRTLLAIGLSILIIIGFQFFFPHSAKPPAPVKPEKAEDKAGSTSAKTAEVRIQDGQALQKYQEGQKGKVARSVKISTDLYQVTISTKGAVITGWQLNDYRDKDKNPVQLISKESEEKGVYPLRLDFDDAGLTQRANQVVYETSADNLILDQRKPDAVLQLSYIDPAGMKITKELKFTNDNYYVGVKVRQENTGTANLPGHYNLVWGYNLGREINNSSHHYTGPSSWIDGELVNHKPADIKGKSFHKGKISWTALQNVYFSSILIPKTDTAEIVVAKEDSSLSIGVSGGQNELAPGAQVTGEFGLYAGPKKIENLSALNMNLDKIIDYGWFEFLARPLIRVLKFSHTFTKNYGWDIVLLTILIKIVFYPLTASSFKSMRKMQVLQPKMNALRKKYKSDPQKLNAEIIDLYKKHKVNPVGGCLPMLLQIPVFFALYKSLLVSIELRHAPFMFWLTDLSAKDPYYVTPVLMGISMFVQQKMTPAADPNQAKVMLFMPLIFTFMFLNFPSGLVVYWLVNNVLGIAQQYWVNKQEQNKGGSPGDVELVAE
ncbi:MAG: membrane protein insertase YidC [Candidatus Schekmanbacteria bacterium]|nr:membrane protein insertase YidC [Candidatus Schekmanbacteria bacterium]